MTAQAIADQGLALAGVTVFQFDAKGAFSERIDAERASLNDGYWELSKALVSRPDREPETFDTFTLSTHLTRERVGDALGSEISVSFWQLPDLIQIAEKTGLSADRYKMQYALLIARPALLITMVILAATVSLRSFRSGGIQTMVVTGMVGGIGFFLLAEASRQVGMPGAIDLMAVCARRTVKADEKQREKVQEDLRAKEFEMLAKRHLRDIRQDAHIEFR